MANAISEVLKAAVLADATMMTLLPGGVYTHEIARSQSQDPTQPSRGSTPLAFEQTPPYRVLRNLSIEEGTQDVNSGGPGGSMWGFPTFWFRAQPKVTEKAFLEDLFLRTRFLFHRKPFPMPSGAGCIVSVIGRLGPMDDKSISDCVVLMVRLQIDGVWRVEP